jgi:hypothetical protein
LSQLILFVQKDGGFGAGFLAETAKDAPGEIDDKFYRIFFPITAFGRCNDRDGLRRADRFTKGTGDAFYLAVIMEL